MSVFAITFRIHQDRTYSDRYDSLVQAIQAQSPAEWWDETTSFFLIESSLSSSDLIGMLVKDSAIDQKKDLLVVINLSKKGYAVHGKYDDEDIENLMKKR